MDTSTLTQKGQIVVPAKFRKALNLHTGDKLAFLIREDQLVLKPVGKGYFDSIRGVLQTKGKVLKELKKEKTKERDI